MVHDRSLGDALDARAALASDRVRDRQDAHIAQLEELLRQVKPRIDFATGKAEGADIPEDWHNRQRMLLKGGPDAD
ncbi:MAG: hypothetical protein AAFQ53_15695 [Bacteroidota bacterium]